jgi:hypothetical protein
MVVVDLSGGLGNQLFQYATGRAISLRTDSDLRLNTVQLGKDMSPDVEKRGLQLKPFNLPVEFVNVAPKSRYVDFLYDKLDNINAKLAAHLLDIYKSKNPVIFDPKVLELPSDIRLLGHWQSEKYFLEYKDRLRQEITISKKPNKENQQWLMKINETNSASIHIRRGDYVNLGRELPTDYYHKAIARLLNSIGDLDLFFFSDDLDWVHRQQDQIIPDDHQSRVHYVDCNNKETGYEDLRLMRTCDHHIIANSTFSWWAAWLNRSNNKYVIAPVFWIRQSIDQLDVVPERWISIGW